MGHALAGARHSFVYEINTSAWLQSLSTREDRPIDLAVVPDEDSDEIAERGFDAVWLMDVWERSPAGVAVALADRDLSLVLDLVPNHVVPDHPWITDHPEPWHRNLFRIDDPDATEVAT